MLSRSIGLAHDQYSAGRAFGPRCRCPFRSRARYSTRNRLRQRAHPAAGHRMAGAGKKQILRHGPRVRTHRRTSRTSGEWRPHRRDDRRWTGNHGGGEPRGLRRRCAFGRAEYHTAARAIPKPLHHAGALSAFPLFALLSIVMRAGALVAFPGGSEHRTIRNSHVAAQENRGAGCPGWRIHWKRAFDRFSCREGVIVLRIAVFCTRVRGGHLAGILRWYEIENASLARETKTL